jgi:hypothetical protein
MQSVSITTIVSSNPVLGEVYSIQHHVIKCVGDLWKVGSFQRILRFYFTNKTDCHDITEILFESSAKYYNPYLNGLKVPPIT